MRYMLNRNNSAVCIWDLRNLYQTETRKRHLHIDDRNRNKELKAKGVSSQAGWAAVLQHKQPQGCLAGVRTRNTESQEDLIEKALGRSI